MANYFEDNKSLEFQLHHPLMRRIVELKERGFTQTDGTAYAPKDYDDAIDSYARVLDIVGEICGDVLAPNAERVDEEGPQVARRRTMRRWPRRGSTGCLCRESTVG